MTEIAEQLRAVTLALLMVTSVFALAGVGSAADGDPSTFKVVQGGECYEVQTMGDGTQSVEDFYDYRHPNSDPPANDYASHGTEHIQENQVSQLMIYNGSQGVSLVMLHDKRADGPYGSTITFDISGLPSNPDWAVEDDDYGEDTDDNFSHGETSSTIDWVWASDRTDGAAVRGLERDDYDAIQIDPGFNQDADRWGEWPYSGDANNQTQAWKLIQNPADADSPSAKTQLNMDQSITIEQGTCGTEDTPPNAALSAQPTTVEEGEQVSFDASDSSDDGQIVEYRWDFDGDDNVDDTTTDPQTTHTYGQNGTYEATVTVVDDADQTDNASVTITVVDPDDEPPKADLQVDPSEAEVGEDEVTFDASGSTDNGDIAQYHWDFDGDGEVDRSTEANVTTYTYQQTGEFDANVTVEDAAGNTATATARVNVSDTTSPTANADVPEQVVKNTTFEVDGSASTDNGQIASYEWDFDDGTTKNGAVVSHSYAENGTYNVTLTVTDTEGNADSTTHEVTVTDEDTQDPTAKIDARDSAHVGEKVTYDGSGSSDDGTIESYEWDFDGTTKTGETVTHSFDSAGTYTVTLEVTDGAGNNDTATHQITIEEKSGDEPSLNADFTWERANQDNKIHFDASNTTGDGDLTYTWNVDGDDTWDQNGVEIWNEYQKFGTYDATLRVNDSAGNVDTVTKTVKVTDRTPPTGEISAPSKVTVGEKFTAKAINYDDNVGVEHLCWSVDGKEVGGDFQETLERTFDKPGEHTIKLRIADANGNDVVLKHTVKVVEKSSGGNGGGGSPGGSSPGGSDDGGNDNKDDSSNDNTIDLGDAKTDEPFTVDLASGTESGDAITAFDTLTVTLSQTGDYDVTIDAVQETPEDVTEPTVESDGFEPLSYLAVGQSDLSGEEIADAEFTFAIEQSRLDALDADAEDVQIYRHEDGQWSAVETEVVEETDEEVKFRASGSDLSTFAVAVDRPVVELTDVSLSATEIAPGETVEVTATIANDGQASGVETFDIAVNGETVDEREVHVDANDERSVTISQTFEEPGTHSISVNGQEVEVVVQSEETATPAETTEATTTSTDGQPGFGVVLAVLALLGAALVALRRR